MKIGILVLSIGSFGNKAYYNLQEIGLAKALSNLFSEIKVYKSVPAESKQIQKEIINQNTEMYYLPFRKIGTNGFPDMDTVDKDLDALICFSDTQLSVPRVYKWCKKYSIKFIPYIGVISSHSENRIIKTLIEVLFNRNISVYKKSTCCVKTPTVQQGLAKMGVNNSVVAPVGLDMDLMKKDYSTVNILDLKTKYGYKADDEVLLFIGRFVEEKQPLKMIDIFSEVHKKDENYKLFMVGSGELKEQVISKIKELNIENEIQMIDKIPNIDIWELYCMADSFVNLNQQEIFGMAILEAMYYGCKVVALKAPGPDYIIEHGINGYLAGNDSELTDCILNKNNDISLSAHDRIVKNFTWQKSAEKFADII